MSPIVPAVIPSSLEEIQGRFQQISSFTHEVQIDIVDGTFVPFSSWPYNNGDDISDLGALTEHFLIETDLMIERPEDTIEAYLKAGVRRVVVHIESTKNVREIYTLKQAYDFRLGLSLNNDTDMQELYEVIEYADYVQVMGIKDIGAQGQPFDERVLDRIRELKEKFSRLIVSIDGSVNFETLPQIARSGVDRCAVGSALLKAPDMDQAFKELEALFVSSHQEQD